MISYKSIEITINPLVGSYLELLGSYLPLHYQLGPPLLLTCSDSTHTLSGMCPKLAHGCQCSYLPFSPTTCHIFPHIPTISHYSRCYPLFYDLFYVFYVVLREPHSGKAMFLQLAARKGVILFWVMEQPASSWMFRMDFMLQLVASFGAIRVCTWNLDRIWL